MSRVGGVGLFAQITKSTLIAMLACACLSVRAPALECPVPQKLGQPGVSKETQTQIDATGKRLSNGDLGIQLQAVIAELRGRYPNAENAEIVNYIVSAYCPVLAGLPGLSEAEKKQRMNGFVRQLMGKVSSTTVS